MRGACIDFCDASTRCSLLPSDGVEGVVQHVWEQRYGYVWGCSVSPCVLHGVPHDRVRAAPGVQFTVIIVSPSKGRIARGRTVRL